MPPIARGQTWLCQPLPVSNVPNTGRSLTVYRGLDEDCAVKIVRRRKYGKIERDRERESEREREIEIEGVCRRAQAVANAWRAVEGVMADWRISKRLRDTGPNYNNKGCKYAKKLGTKNSKSNEGRQGKNGGVKADYTRERLSYVRRAE